MSKALRSRPPLFRALGRCDPPHRIEISGRVYYCNKIFKHDSWAATALYSGDAGTVVCKFNRIQPIFGVSVNWLGRRLARQESLGLRLLKGVRGIPIEAGPVLVNGARQHHAVAHYYIPGHPLAFSDTLQDDFFPSLKRLLQVIHDRNMAYVDLHKRENILVGQDGDPYLIDFQVCFSLHRRRSFDNPFWCMVLRELQQADWYHLAKHIRRHRPDQVYLLHSIDEDLRPDWIKIHRRVAAPLREFRRRLLAGLGIRAKGGRASTEVFPEEAIRRELEHAA